MSIRSANVPLSPSSALQITYLVLPLALAKGAGAELRVPLGVSIIGGLLLSQVLTLYTTPVIYLTLNGIRRRLIELGPVRQRGGSPPRVAP